MRVSSSPFHSHDRRGHRRRCRCRNELPRSPQATVQCVVHARARALTLHSTTVDAVAAAGEFFFFFIIILSLALLSLPHSPRSPSLSDCLSTVPLLPTVLRANTPPPAGYSETRAHSSRKRDTAAVADTRQDVKRTAGGGSGSGSSRRRRGPCGGCCCCWTMNCRDFRTGGNGQR